MSCRRRSDYWCNLFAYDWVSEQRCQMVSLVSCPHYKSCGYGLLASGSGGDDVVTMQFVKDLGMLKALRVLRTKINIISESMERAWLESLGNLSNIRPEHAH
jgi:hypothetical protein